MVHEDMHIYLTKKQNCVVQKQIYLYKYNI